MEDAAHVAAAGLDAHRYLSSTHPADLIVLSAVADRARQLRHDDMASAFGVVE